ncbi:MAG: Asp23/Gls24 family envelope stress response protein [Clostridiaceae bacterium]|nr:Asp23/Gls24 family envelope stress response protein [Clostridiaceae bacterium]
MTEELKNTVVEESNEDKLKIVDEVIETIAGIEASKVRYVTSMSGGFTDGLAGILGKKNLGKGVKVETLENKVKVFLSIVVEYGCKIHMVARDVQSTVRAAIEEMTGLEVAEVNVNVVDISIPREGKKEETAEETGEEK